MNIFNKKLQIRVIKIIDVATIAFCFELTFFMTQESIPFSSLLSRRVELKELFWFAIFILIWHVTFWSAGLYYSRRIGGRLQEYVAILKCTSLGSLFMSLAGYLLGIEYFNKSFIFIFWSSSSLVIILGRVILRYALAVVRSHGINQRMVLIVGTGKRAQGLAKMIQAKKELGYGFIGFVDDDWVGLGGLKNSSLLLGDLNGWIIDGDGVVETTYNELGTTNPRVGAVGSTGTGLFGLVVAALETKGIYYNPDSYPYFYTATGGQFRAFTPNTLAASFNLAYAYKAGNAVYVHNAKYVIQVLRDGLQALNGAVPPGTRPVGTRDATDYRTIVITP